MGLFDFLHGRPPKSESQIYMEQRNKEYAKKVAAYNKIEAKWGHQSDNPIININHKPYKSTPVMAKQQIQINKSQSIKSKITHPKISDCLQCDTSPSLYDGKEKSAFIITKASANAARGTVTASGIIKRGSFQVGDTVDVITSLETRSFKIVAMWRQGVKIEYANSSAGPIGMVFSNAADMLMRQNDRVVKY